eukprot:TRINITY_DN5725_c0_g1_i1.p4 TRINITY_DN5725_c0_g1~~TRINITY_DN5725_c0_g1_i1.p4  ORF type:complete len:148 (-),score=18.12 TRINITY_DN5725_c0_g1_i1:321-764(-)
MRQRRSVSVASYAVTAQEARMRLLRATTPRAQPRSASCAACYVVIVSPAVLRLRTRCASEGSAAVAGDSDPHSPVDCAYSLRRRHGQRQPIRCVLTTGFAGAARRACATGCACAGAAAPRQRSEALHAIQLTAAPPLQAAAAVSTLS